MWDSLGKILPQRLEQLRLKRGVEAEQVLLLWPDVAGRLLGSDLTEVKAVSIDDGILAVSVSSGIWASEIRLKEKTLINELNKHPLSQPVRGIKTKLEDTKNPRANPGS